MATMRIPQALLERLKASPRRLGDSSPLTDDEREHLALHLEWLAAEVREKPVAEASWSMDRDVEHDPFCTVPAIGPWKYTVEVQVGHGEGRR